MDPFRILGPAFATVMAIGQPEHAPPRDPAPVVAPEAMPLPRERPPAEAEVAKADATGTAEAAVSDETTGSIPATVLTARSDRLDRAGLRGGLTEAAAGDGAGAGMPLPKPRPVLLASVAPLVPSELRNVMRAGPRVAPKDDPYCQPQMASLAATFTPLAPIEDGDCRIAAPIKLAAIGAGEARVKLTPAATVDCRVGSALSRWLDEDVQPAAEAAFGGRVTGLRIAASYSCRTRDNIEGAPLSEHAFGNAIDISAFRIGEGKTAEWVEIGPREDPEAPDAKFLTAIRAGACGPFRTVLGPGSDSYHASHFHFDLAQRGKRGKNRGLFCR